MAEKLEKSRTIQTANYQLFLQVGAMLINVLISIKALNSDFIYDKTFILGLAGMFIIPFVLVFTSLLIKDFRKEDHKYLVKGGKYCEEHDEVDYHI